MRRCGTLTRAGRTTVWIRVSERLRDLPSGDEMGLESGASFG